MKRSPLNFGKMPHISHFSPEEKTFELIVCSNTNFCTYSKKNFVMNLYHLSYFLGPWLFHQAKTWTRISIGVKATHLPTQTSSQAKHIYARRPIVNDMGIIRIMDSLRIVEIECIKCRI